MTSQTSEQPTNLLGDNNYVSQDNWQSYVNESDKDRSYEFLGYLDATRGIVTKLKQALLENEPEQFKTIISELVTNRESLIEYAEAIMDTEMASWPRVMKPR